MKSLTTYISHMKDLYSLNEYLNEKLVINKNYNNPYTCDPSTFEELRKIIEDRYDKLGPGTEQKPIDFNDVNISNIDSFYDGTIGIFEITKFEYIDISRWDVSSVENMFGVFFDCHNLKSVGYLSKWNVSNVKDISYMFYGCYNLNTIGNLSKWDVSSVEDISYMFRNCYKLESVGNLSKWDVSSVEDTVEMFSGCEKLKSIGDLSKWNVSKCENMSCMFYGCINLKSVGDLSKWDVSNVMFTDDMFKDSGITNIPDWYKE